MAERQESGKERQQRIQREQHRPEQNAGYDEAADGPGGANSVAAVPPMPPDEERSVEAADIDEREAQGAAADVRRQDHSAD